MSLNFAKSKQAPVGIEETSVFDLQMWSAEIGRQRSQRKWINQGHTGVAKISRVSCHNRQSMLQRRSGDQAVFDWHRLPVLPESDK